MDILRYIQAQIGTDPAQLAFIYFVLGAVGFIAARQTCRAVADGRVRWYVPMALYVTACVAAMALVIGLDHALFVVGALSIAAPAFVVELGRAERRAGKKAAKKTTTATSSGRASRAREWGNEAAEARNTSNEAAYLSARAARHIRQQVAIIQDASHDPRVVSAAGRIALAAGEITEQSSLINRVLELAGAPRQPLA